MMPLWLPDDFDIGLLYAGKAEQTLLSVAGDHSTHAATGRGEGHLYGDGALAAGHRRDLHIIHKTQVHDVDWDLGVIAGLQGIPDRFFIGWTVGSFGQRFGCWFETECVGIF